MDIIVVNRKKVFGLRDYFMIDIMQSNKAILGNPFYKDHVSRDERIKRFRTYLWAELKKMDSLVRLELYSLAQSKKNLALVCCCSPEPCHGDVVKSCLEWLIKKHKF